MNNKKVGLITYYGNNYGGCLQAYAIQQVLNHIGYNPYIIQVSIPLSSSKYNKFEAIFRVLRNPIAFLKRKKYIKENSRQELLRSAAFDKFRQEFLTFDKSFTLKADSLDGAGNYTSFVCGSDQIWNPNLYGVHPIWTLKFAPTGARKIAYAPSLGISTIPEQYIQDFKDNLKDFAYISCREQEGAESLSNILGQSVDVVLDPTLLLSPEQWHKFSRPV